VNAPLFEASQYLHLLQAYWWPFCRILALFSMAPLFNHKSISIRVRVLLALALTIALGAALPQPPLIDPLSLRGLMTAFEQILFGVLLGLALQLVFTIFMVIGEVVSTQMGMSMARYNDPMNGVSSSSIVYQVYFCPAGISVFFHRRSSAHRQRPLPEFYLLADWQWPAVSQHRQFCIRHRLGIFRRCADYLAGGFLYDAGAVQFWSAEPYFARDEPVLVGLPDYDFDGLAVYLPDAA
jgi:hypothetical protein